MWKTLYAETLRVGGNTRGQSPGVGAEPMVFREMEKLLRKYPKKRNEWNCGFEIFRIKVAAMRKLRRSLNESPLVER